MTNNLKLSNSEKLGLISNLATMLAAGISILETIDSLIEDAKSNQKKLLLVLKEDIMQGKRIYLSLSKFPKVFDQVTINLIKASEEAGTLDSTLKDLKDNIKKEMEFFDSIRSAMVYPVLIMLVFLGVLFMMLIVVVPKISTVFSKLKMELPLPTKILITTSNLLVNNTALTIMVLILIVLSLIFLYKVNRKIIFNIFFSFPLISNLIKEIDLTRFSRSLYFLLSAGIPITTALELSQDIVLRGDIKRIIEHSRDMVYSGKKLSDGLKTARGKIPSIMIKITEAGERSGSLDRSMLEVADFLDYQVTGSLKTITVLIEPVMLVVVGILVGGMMLAIIAPIYGLVGQVGAR